MIFSILLACALLFQSTLASCTQDCSPIVADGLFEFLGNGDSRSAWSVTNASLITFATTDRLIYIDDDVNHGFYTLAITPRSNVSIHQTIQIPATPPSKKLILSFYLDCDSSNSFVLAADGFEYFEQVNHLHITLNGTIVAVLPIGPLCSKELHNFDISAFGAGSYKLEFLVSSNSTTLYSIVIFDSVTVYAKYSSLLASDVYVSNTRGNDVLATGNNASPFCSIGLALESIAPGYTIYVEAGTYCAYTDHQFTIRKPVKIVGINGSVVIDLLYQWPGVLVYADNVGLSSLALIHANFGPTIMISATYNTTLNNVTIGSAGPRQFLQTVLEGVSGLIVLQSSNVLISGINFDRLPLNSFVIADSSGNVNGASFSSYVRTISVARSAFTITNVLIGPMNTSSGAFYCIDITASSISLLSGTFRCPMYFLQSTGHLEIDFTNLQFNTHNAITITRSNITVYKSSFDSLILDAAIALLDARSTLTVSSSSFSNLIAKSVSIGYGQGTISDCTFEHVKGEIFFAYKNAVITASNCTCADSIANLMSAFGATIVLRSCSLNPMVTGSSAPATINGIESNILIERSNISGLNIGTGFHIASTKISVLNSTVHHNNASTLFFVSQNSTVNVLASTISDGTHASASIECYESSLNIISSSFKRNDATISPILVDHSSVVLAYSAFSDNRGISGGVLKSNQPVVAYNCTFKNNLSQQGGVIYVSSDTVVETIPDFVGLVNFSHVEATENTALFGGGVVFSNGVVKVIDTFTEYENNTAPYGEEIATNPFQLALSEPLPAVIKSGITVLRHIEVYMKDKLGQNAVVQGAHQAYIRIGGQNIASAEFINGSATFSNVVLYGAIGKNLSYSIITTNSKLDPISVPVYVQGCDAGYVPADDICTPCPEQTYGYDGNTCEQCPDHATCLGGRSVETLSGYWFDPSEMPVRIYACGKHGCAGNNTCDPHHSGVLCAQCEEGFYDWGKGCQECEHTSGALVVVGIVGTIIIIMWNMRSAGSTSGFFAIFMYFVQTLIVVADGVNFGFVTLFNFNIGSQKSSGSIPKELCPGPYDYFDRYYFTYIVPFILFGFLVAGIGAEYLLHKIRIMKRTPQKTRHFGTVVNLVLFIYGPVIGNVFGVFFCEEVADVQLLVANNSVECSGYRYHKARVVGFCLLTVVIGVPAAFFILLEKRRHQLDKEHNKRVWGALYMQFKPEYFYWSIVILVRRFFITIFALLSYARAVRAFLLMLATLVTALLQIKFKPFVSPKDNMLEALSLVLLFLYSCFLDNGNDDTLQWVVLFVGVIFGSATLYFFGTKIIDTIKNKKATKKGTKLQTLTTSASAGGLLSSSSSSTVPPSSP